MASGNSKVPPSGEILDADELLHLAVSDIQAGKHEDAISRLKRGLTLKPKDGRFMFLLAAEHAEVGMIDRAIEEMTEAVEVNPDLAIGHFQLGLLYLLYRNDVESARQKWTPLDGLDNVEGLIAFKTGLLALSEGKTGDCLRELDLGLRLNVTNPSLNREMTKIRTRIGEMQAEKAGASAESEQSKASENLLLKTYGSSTK